MHVYHAITKNQVLDVHAKLTVSAAGFNLIGNLDFIFDGWSDFPEIAGITPQSQSEKIYYMASYLLFHLVKGHCFNDGNKRTAFLSFGLFCQSNGAILEYDEKHVSKKLDLVNTQISQGVQSMAAIDDIFRNAHQSAEYQLIALLFALAGSNPAIEYDSPLDIFTEIQRLIKFKEPSIVEDRKMDNKPMTTRKSKYKGIPLNDREAMAIVDELIKKYPKTLKLLEKS